MKVQRRSFLVSLVLAGVVRPALSASLGASGSILPSCNAWVDTELKLGDTFTVAAALVSEREPCWIYIPISFGSLGFLYAIKDRRNGKWLDTPNAPQPHPFVPQTPIGQHSFMKLDQGMIVGAKIAQKVADIFPAAGVYTLQVTYMSPVLQSEISGADGLLEKVVTRECGTIFGPLLDVEVS